MKTRSWLLITALIMMAHDMLQLKGKVLENTHVHLSCQELVQNIDITIMSIRQL